LLAAFQVVVGRWVGVFGCGGGFAGVGAVAGGVEGLVGFFVNTVALRTDLSGDPTFAEVLERVKAVVMEGFAHQDVPFDQVVERIRPARDASRNPLFQLMFTLARSESAPGGDQWLELPGIEITDSTWLPPPAQFDLTMLAIDIDDTELSLELEYNVDLFDESTVVRLRSHLLALLAAVVAAAGSPVGRIELLQ